VLGEDLTFMRPCWGECHDIVFAWLNICFATISLIERFDHDNYVGLVEYVEKTLDDTRCIVRRFTGRQSRVGEQYIADEFSKHPTKLQKFQLGLKNLF
jgi:hypothetical protein